MNMPSSKDLRGISFLTDLPAADLAAVGETVEELRYASGETIFEQGHPCPGLYILKEGRVKLLRTSKDKEYLLAILSAGEPLDLVPFLDGGPCSCTAKARGRAVLYFINSTHASRLIWNHPALLNAVLSAVAARVRNLCSLATDLAFKDVATRVCQVLLNLAGQEGERRPDGIHLQRTFSQSEFASLAGTSREVAWRKLKMLEAEGLIRVDSNEILLLEPERLAERTC
jgi:CRP-like cAMP-binding protein